jgi:hypothetical protein
MQRTPSQAFEQVKESLVQYLETAYKIAHPAVFAERGDMLRARGTVAQQPFIEATPSFPTAHKLAELERLYPSILPSGLAELVQHGVPVLLLAPASLNERPRAIFMRLGIFRRPTYLGIHQSVQR